jgi:hypothetical protein
MFGMGTVTLKFTGLLCWPPTATTTFPVVAVKGTETSMLVLLQFVTVARVSLKVTALVPCVPPKLVPVIVRGVPPGPDVVDRLEMLGVGVTVNGNALLAILEAVTITFPVVAPFGTDTLIIVALQYAGVALISLKVTVLLPWAAPKLPPVIVIWAPGEPALFESDEMKGNVRPENFEMKAFESPARDDWYSPEVP